MNCAANKQLLYFFISVSFLGNALLSGGAVREASALPEAYIPELHELLESADQKAPQLIEQALEGKEADERLKQAEAAFYPRIDLYSTIGYRQTTYDTVGVEDETSAGANFVASISRPFYHWGAIEAAIDQAKIDNETQAIQRALILRQIHRGLRADYLNLLVNNAVLDKLNLEREHSLEQIQEFEASASEGRVSGTEAALAKTNLKQHLMSIDRLIMDQDRIKDSFARKAGWEAPLTLDAEMPSPDLLQLEAFIEERASPEASLAWLDKNGTIQTIENQLEREKHELTRIKAIQKPLVNFSASATQDQRNVGLENNVDAITYFVGLSVSWNVFDGFTNRARKREALLRTRRVEQHLINLQNEISAQAKHVLQQLDFHVDQLRLDTDRAKLLKERYKFEKGELEAGRRSKTDLRNYAIQSADAQVNLVRSKSVLLLLINDYLDLTLPVIVEPN